MKYSAAAFALSCSTALVGVVGCETGQLDDSIRVHHQAYWADIVPGHERILRYAIDHADELLPADDAYWAGEIQAKFPRAGADEDCLETDYKVLHGNCATDFPDDEMMEHYGSNDDDWHTSPNLQSLHALRNWHDMHDGRGLLKSAKQACYDAQSRIVLATTEALYRYDTGDLAMAQYYVGHATHIIQDSISPAHVLRSGPDFRQIDDICTYGYEVDGVCYHSTISWADNPMTSTDDPYDCADLDQGPPAGIDRTCFRPQSGAAIRATTGYLRAVAQLMENRDLITATVLNDYFYSTADRTMGYLNCDDLSEEMFYFDLDSKWDDPHGHGAAGEPEATAGGCRTSGTTGTTGLLLLLGLVGLVARRRR